MISLSLSSRARFASLETATVIISLPSSVPPREKAITRGLAAATAFMYFSMSAVWCRMFGAPMTSPRIEAGVGTESEAGRWSTSSVRKNFSEVYSRIFLVYSSSCFC